MSVCPSLIWSPRPYYVDAAHAMPYTLRSPLQVLLLILVEGAVQYLSLSPLLLSELLALLGVEIDQTLHLLSQEFRDSVYSCG